jgi:hypothetical protein
MLQPSPTSSTSNLPPRPVISATQESLSNIPTLLLHIAVHDRPQNQYLHIELIACRGWPGIAGCIRRDIQRVDSGYSYWTIRKWPWFRFVFALFGKVLINKKAWFCGFHSISTRFIPSGRQLGGMTWFPAFSFPGRRLPYVEDSSCGHELSIARLRNQSMILFAIPRTWWNW